MGTVQRFPIQEGLDIVDPDGVQLFAIVHADQAPTNALANSLLPPTLWFDRNENLIYWKARAGSGFDKWALIGEDQVKQAEEIDFVITGAGPSEVTTIYIGRAVIGSITSAAVWSITRTIVESGLDSDSSKQWADGDANFDNVWDDRKTTVVYS